MNLQEKFRIWNIDDDLNWENFKVNCGIDSSNIFQDPKLDINYKRRKGSPCSKYVFNSPYKFDYKGNKIDNTKIGIK